VVVVALAYRTKILKKVDMIAGQGNAYVNKANCWAIIAADKDASVDYNCCRYNDVGRTYMIAMLIVFF
jgi:hypothetical protein